MRFKKRFITKKVGNKNTKYYLFGIRIWKKNNPFSTKNLENKIDNLARSILENKILLLNSYYNSINTEKLILCVDALHDKYAECIDAYTFFKFLQEKGIPSKYILLEDNPLYNQLKQENKLKDIVGIKKQWEFIEKNAHLIAQAKCVLTSYGLSSGPDNLFLKNLPFLKYIFIEHGVILLKKWVVQLYNTNAFDKILVPSQATYNFYKSKNLYGEQNMVKCGLPRWDRLKKERSGTKNIFLFFTWRYSKNKDEFDVYFGKIKELISALNNLIKNNNIKIYFSIHHSLLDLGFSIPQYNNIEFVSTTNISKMIGKTDLLITDYSSICFDFMYLNTPVIFYKFDGEVKYSDKRDNESFLSAQEEDKNLYNCFYTLDEVVEKINYYIQHNFELESENKEKNKKIFWTTQKNCESLLTYIEEK